MSFSLMKRWITDAGRASRVGEPDVFDRITWIRPHVPEDSDLVLMSTKPEAAFERAEALALDLPHVALRFAAAFEGVATTIVGLGNPAEVEAALRAFASPLDAAERRFAAEVRELF